MARTVASDVSFTLFGLVNFTADLLPLTESKKAAEFRMVCAGCFGDDPEGTPQKLRQQYVCDSNPKHGPFTSGEAARATELGTGKNAVLAYVTDAEVESVKEPTLPPKEMSVSVFPAAQVDAATRPSGKAYRLFNDKAQGQAVLRVIASLIADSEYAFVGECNVARSQGFYRLLTWKGEIILQELARPDEVIEFTESADAVNPRALEQAKKAAAATVENFDAVAFRNTVRERARALNDAKATGVPVPVAAPTTKAASGMDDLLALLEAAAAQTA